MDLDYTMIAEKIFQRGYDAKGEAGDLHLAATVGKMLLEKNSDLEEKLTRLQQVAEQTAQENETLSRQLWASKESLHMSSQLAEHLESKLNESEEEVEQLQRQCDLLQLELNKSDGHLHHSEALLEEQATEVLQLKRKVDDLQLERRRVEQELESERRKTVSPMVPFTPPMGTSSAECTLLAEELASLRSKLEQSQACKMKLERQLSDVALEKAGLEQQVTLAEETVEELRSRLAATEDIDSGLVSGSTRLKRSKSMLYGGKQCNAARRPSHSSSPLKSPQTLEPRPSLHPHSSGSRSPTNIPSLWSELDSQCTTVQGQFDQWVQKCNCSASLEYQKYVKARQMAQQEESKERTQPPLQPFKNIFDELFSSIKETTAVANRLLSKGQEQVKT